MLRLIKSLEQLRQCKNLQPFFIGTTFIQLCISCVGLQPRPLWLIFISSYWPIFVDFDNRQSRLYWLDVSCSALNHLQHAQNVDNRMKKIWRGKLNKLVTICRHLMPEQKKNFCDRLNCLKVLVSMWYEQLQTTNEEGHSMWSNVVCFRTLPDRPQPPSKLQVKGRVTSHCFRCVWGKYYFCVIFSFWCVNLSAFWL